MASYQVTPKESERFLRFLTFNALDYYRYGNIDTLLDNLCDEYGFTINQLYAAVHAELQRAFKVVAQEPAEPLKKRNADIITVLRHEAVFGLPESETKLIQNFYANMISGWLWIKMGNSFLFDLDNMGIWLKALPPRGQGVILADPSLKDIRAPNLNRRILDVLLFKYFSINATKEDVDRRLAEVTPAILKNEMDIVAGVQTVSKGQWPSSTQEPFVRKALPQIKELTLEQIAEMSAGAKELGTVSEAFRIATALRALQPTSVGPKFAITTSVIFDENRKVGARSQDLMLRLFAIRDVMRHQHQFDAQKAASSSWIPKIIRRGMGSDQITALTLADAYDAWTTGSPNREGTLLRAILDRLENDPRGVITDKYMAHEIGEDQNVLNNALRCHPRDLWRFRKNAWKPHPVLKSIAGFLHTKPLQLFPPPATPQSNTASQPSREYILNAEVMHIFNMKADDLINTTMKRMGIAENSYDIRMKLENALLVGEELANVYGIPNLVYLQFMWGAKPETLYLKADETAKAYIDLYKIEGSGHHGRSFTDTARGGFLWTIALQARDGLPILDYHQFLEHRAASHLEGQTSEEAFDKVMDALFFAEIGMEANRYPNSVRTGIRILQTLMANTGVPLSAIIGPARGTRFDEATDDGAMKARTGPWRSSERTWRHLQDALAQYGKS